MKCDVETVSPCTRKLKVDVPSHAVQAAFDEYYVELSKRAKVPGFRQGKAPKQVLKMHYGNEARDEVMRRLISTYYHKAISDTKLNPLGYPNFKDVDFGEDKLSFKAEVDVKPELNIKKYKKIAVKRDKVSVEDKEVDETISRIGESYAKYIPVEDRGVILGDFVVCDIVNTVEGEAPEEKKDEWCEVQENDMIKGFATQVVGMKSGEQRLVDVTIAGTFANKKVAGKKAQFNVTIKEIKQRQLPEFDEEMLKQLGDYKSLDDLKEAVRKDIEARKMQETESILERKIIDEIEKSVKCDLPQSIIERRLESMVSEGISNLVRQGMKQEEADAKKEEFRKEFKKEAERQVRVAFILDKIAETEHIEVGPADIEARYTQIAQQARYPAEKVKEYYEQNNMVDSLEAELRNRNVIDFLKEQADIT